MMSQVELKAKRDELQTGTEKTGEQSESPTSVQVARRRKSSMVHL